MTTVRFIGLYTTTVIRTLARLILPFGLRQRLRAFWYENDPYRTLLRLRSFGWQHYCPICRAHLKRFALYRSGTDPVWECPICYSHGRHRMLWLWLPRTDLFDGRRRSMLHVAPTGGERPIALKLMNLSNLEHVGIDLTKPEAGELMDITALSYPADRFDVILCNHVLEHVPADRVAMAELFRVLKPGGWAILQVPILRELTHEDPSITDPAERERWYGQADHVRAYGRDYADRLRSCGFEVSPIPYETAFGDRQIARCQLIAQEDRTIWYCRKPAGSSG
jgi:hypothetical protein